ncbi:hypothetical protein J3U99_18185 [Brucella pituitosa]|uniref:hypothetical protein n=1 Tax=Brucella pituitosa TaxID=571256 RepID=UPI0011B00C56|nr:hypothetical protein [Brucella pituitosa]MCK4206709.1 hypothetical protein [Brucella pituitosa]
MSGLPYGASGAKSNHDLGLFPHWLKKSAAAALAAVLCLTLGYVAGRLSDGMKKMRDQIGEGLKETNKRLNQVLAVLAQDKKV